MVSQRLAYWPVAYLIFIEFCDRFVSFNKIISKVLLERFFNDGFISRRQKKIFQVYIRNLFMLKMKIICLICKSVTNFYKYELSNRPIGQSMTGFFTCHTF